MKNRFLAASLAAGALLALPAAAQAQSTTLVINEFDYDQPGTDTAEFVEIRNVSSGPINLDPYRLSPRNGATAGTEYSAVDLPSVVLAAGDRYVVCGNSANVANCDLDTPPDSDFIQNGAPDAVALLNAGAVVDTVSYEGNTTGFTEGTGVSPGENNNAPNVSTSRSPDGCDTDANSADFASLAPTPGEANTAGSCGGQPPADDAPSVVSTDPANNQADVGGDSNLTVNFSEPVTAQTSAFALTCDGTPISLAVSKADADSYSLDPQQTLPTGARCTLAVEGDNYTDDDTVDPPNTGSDHTTRFTTVGATGLRIHDIQGASHLSPYEDDVVTRVPGVVTAVRSNGFYMQDTQPDGSDATSEGIFVFTSSAPGVVKNAAVEVSGTVSEFRAGCEPTCAPTASAFDNLTITEIDFPTVYPAGTADPIGPTLVGAGGYEPPLRVTEDDALGNVEIGNVLFDPEEDGLDWHESLEGMLVEIANPEVTGLRTTFGELPVVSGGAAELRTPRGGVVIQDGDMNPERFILEDVLAPTPTAQVGDTLGDSVVAIADYGFGDYLYYPTSAPTVTPGNLQREVTEPKRANQLAIASMNVENLDPTDPPSKFAELADIVVENLRSPDILAVEEVQDNDGATDSGTTDATATYVAFIAAIQAAGGPQYEFRQVNPNDKTDGGEPGGNIRVGFLYRTDGDLEFVDRPGATADTPNSVVRTRKGAALKYSPGRLDPTNEAFDSSRKPLAAEFLWKGRTVFAIANHFNSKGGDDPLGGRFQPPVESSTVQRHKQANVVAGFVEDLLDADPRAAVAVLGDLNDFQFSETLEILEGAGLANLMKTLPAEEQYSYVFDGNSQVLDQILVSKELLTPHPEYDSVHVNAEFADQASDHDPQIARVVVRGTGNANGQ